MSTLSKQTQSPIKLGLGTINKLPPMVAVPAYKRQDLSPGIVHIGVGNFHRAHMALYMHDLFNLGLNHDWAIVGAGVRANDAVMRTELAAQDFLTTLVEIEPGNDQAKVTAAMVDFVEVMPDNSALIRIMCDPQIRIVSLTVTEGGYYINPALGRFDQGHADIVHDIDNRTKPKTAFGAIIEALKLRREAGIGPFTVMSCDNLPENGDVAKNTIMGLAQAVDLELADWIAKKVTFPNSMVDRITPATTDVERTLVRDQYGILDARPVPCEPFRQWVLEDEFCAGRPDFEKVGVTVTKDVVPFETMKIRILNGGHAAMAYPSAMLNIEYVHDAAAHPIIRAFLDKLEREEIIPNVDPVPGTNLGEYYDKVIERLINPGVCDQISRLCFDGSNRQPKFIIPSINDRLSAGAKVDGLALASAFWCRYCYGTTESGSITPSNDPVWARLCAVSKVAKDNPRAWLEMRDIYGNISENAEFARLFAKMLNSIWLNGSEDTIKNYLS